VPTATAAATAGAAFGFLDAAIYRNKKPERFLGRTPLESLQGDIHWQPHDGSRLDRLL
jgi:hypothetical protein